VVVVVVVERLFVNQSRLTVTEAWGEYGILEEGRKSAVGSCCQNTGEDIETREDKCVLQ
jgi:hypothetical protein